MTPLAGPRGPIYVRREIIANIQPHPRGRLSSLACSGIDHRILVTGSVNTVRSHLQGTKPLLLSGALHLVTLEEGRGPRPEAIPLSRVCFVDFARARGEILIGIEGQVLPMRALGTPGEVVRHRRSPGKAFLEAMSHAE